SGYRDAALSGVLRRSGPGHLERHGARAVAPDLDLLLPRACRCHGDEPPQAAQPRQVEDGQGGRVPAAGGPVHFHAIIRLDAAPPADDPEAVAPPPEQFTVDVLERAVRAVRDS